LEGSGPDRITPDRLLSPDRPFIVPIVQLRRLEIETVIDDPKAYTAPFTVKLTQQLAPDTELIEMICQENNRTIDHLAT